MFDGNLLASVVNNNGQWVAPFLSVACCLLKIRVHCWRRKKDEGPREPSKVFQKNPLTNRLVEIFLTSISRQSIENYMNFCLAIRLRFCVIAGHQDVLKWDREHLAVWGKKMTKRMNERNTVVEGTNLPPSPPPLSITPVQFTYPIYRQLPVPLRIIESLNH